MQGNVGTSYRQRTQVTMFFFIFMGAGLVEKLGRTAAAARAAADLELAAVASAAGSGGTATIVDHDLVYPLEDHDFIYPDDGDPVPRA
jgi:hypothetical protein